MRILISAGEASGELYGAKLIEALRQEAQNRGIAGSIEFFGVGGAAMRAAGCDLVIDAHEIAVVGLAEVVEHLPRIYRRFRELVNEVDRRRPDVAVLIDFPDFNFRLAKQLHKRGIPVIYYVSPQLWAWRQSRIALVRKYVREMLVIFPFEENFYRQHNVRAQFVGHPLADLPVPSISREQFPAEDDLDPGKPWIALLPGSRKGEVARIFPTLLESAQLLGPEYVYTVPIASTLSRDWMGSFVQKQPGVKVHFTRDARATLLHARAAVVASGTSTLEAALIGTPFVMVYRVAALTWLLGRRLVKVDRFAMANLIAGKDVVPELVQHNFTAREVCRQLRPLLSDGERREAMIEAFREIRQKLAPGADETASQRAARAVFDAWEPHKITRL